MEFRNDMPVSIASVETTGIDDQRNLRRIGEYGRCIVCGADCLADKNHKCREHDYPRKDRTRKRGQTVGQRIGFGFFLMGLDGSGN